MGTPNGSAEGKTKIHNQHISGFDNLLNFHQDSFKDQLKVMFDVFTSLDKSLGNKVRKLFGEQPIEDKSFMGKTWDKTRAAAKGLFSKKKKGSENATEMQDLNESQNIGGSAPQAGEAKMIANLEEELKNNNQQTTQYSNINNALNGLDNFTKNKAKTSDEQNKIKTALANICQLDSNISNAYKSGKRDEFLVSVSKYLGFKCFGVKSDSKKGIVDIEELCKDEGVKTWQKIISFGAKSGIDIKKYQNNIFILLIQKVRNLIATGLNMGGGNKLPQINLM